jgi:hypothetical protein
LCNINLYIFQLQFLIAGNRCNPSKRENRQNGNQESSQETSREESRKESGEEEVTADPTKKATLKGGASSVPLGVLGQNSPMNTGENA